MSTTDKLDISFLESLDLADTDLVTIDKERLESGSRSRAIEVPIAIGSEVSTFTVSVGDRTKTLSFQEFQDILERRIEQSVAPSARGVVDEAIQGLLKSRDFLGLQLDHAWGNITDEDFEQRAQAYLAVKEQGDRATLNDKVRILHWYLSVRLDSETVADIFNCRLDDAELALKGVEPRVLGSLPQGEEE